MSSNIHPDSTSQDTQSQIPRISAQALMQSAREIVIEYQGNDYRLRITSNEKLILTK
ncbi:hemin uptake protein HemP [Kiloniella antarctica]|uniref:Hemin uptake protein HemP n=1 Tax=Kiloniella antarctica TaxID=1550907 RepID=A0ABW5BPU1_9PROT